MRDSAALEVGCCQLHLSLRSPMSLLPPLAARLLHVSLQSTQSCLSTHCFQVCTHVANTALSQAAPTLASSLSCIPRV